jgi:hypothetical protein
MTAMAAMKLMLAILYIFAEMCYPVLRGVEVTHRRTGDDLQVKRGRLSAFMAGKK